MNIALALTSIENLQEWETRIIDFIRTEPSLNLSLIITDKRYGLRDHPDKKRKFGGIAKLLVSTILKIQSYIEKKLFLNSGKEKNSHSTIEEFLKSVSILEVKNSSTGVLEYDDIEFIRAYDLDVIIKHNFGALKGAIRDVAKYGIWCLYYGEKNLSKGKPIGFWEILQDEPGIGITLQRLTRDGEEGVVIDRAFYNRHWSYIKNKNFVLNKAVILLIKNLNKFKNGSYKEELVHVRYNQYYKMPSLSTISKYLLYFYSNLVKKLYEKIYTEIGGARFNCWSIFLGEGEFMTSSLPLIKCMDMPGGEFWADPFIYNFEGQDFVFFERFLYEENKGQISCGELSKDGIHNVVDVLNFDIHLSYPFIFEEKNEIFMIPDTHEKHRLDIYKCTKFPQSWELYSTAFEGESLVDTTYYKDKNGQRWIFTNKGDGRDHSSELYIYKIESLKLKKIEAHKQNPVIIDSRIARNAGPIFQRNGELIRPSQNNSYGVYGYGLNLNRIKQLDIESYNEEKILQIEPNFKENLVSIHHLHQTDKKFLLDAAFYRK